jgi:predicted permease
MSILMSKLLEKITLMISAIFVIAGSFSLPVIGVIFYLLSTGQIEPGSNIWHGDKAPTILNCVIATLISTCFILFGFYLKNVITQKHS